MSALPVSSPGLTSTVARRYGSFTFPVETETQSINCTYNYATDGRTVVSSTISITVRSVVNLAADETTDVDLETIRQQLSKPGQQLQWNAIGFGDPFEINIGRVRDAVWGPKPRLLNWRPLGAVSSEFTWQVDVCIPECVESNIKYELAIMEYCWALSYSVDQAGYTTRTYNGHIRIPQTRRSATERNLSFSADEFRDRVNARTPAGFRRTTRTFQLSEDKCQLSFSITDEQMPPHVPPPGVVLVDASHQMEAAGPAWVEWVGTISATYEVARGTPRGQSWENFLFLARERMAPLKTAGKTLIPLRITMAEPEIYGRRSGQFTLTYQSIFPIDKLELALPLTGLFRRPPLSDWKDWSESMIERGVWGIRGHAGLKFDYHDDAIVDLCMQDIDKGVPLQRDTPRPQQPGRQGFFAPPPFAENRNDGGGGGGGGGGDRRSGFPHHLTLRPPFSAERGPGDGGGGNGGGGDAGKPKFHQVPSDSVPPTPFVPRPLRPRNWDLPGQVFPPPSGGGALPGKIGGGGGGGGGANFVLPFNPGGAGFQAAGEELFPTPAPNASWLDYQSGIEVESEDETIEMRLLPTEAVVYDGSRLGAGYTLPYKNTGAAHAVQYRSRPGVYVTITGRAVRACYSISPPHARLAGGVPLIPANIPGLNYFRTSVVGNTGGFPLCLAQWRLRYLVPAPPTTSFAPPDNPFYGSIASVTG